MKPGSDCRPVEGAAAVTWALAPARQAVESATATDMLQSELRRNGQLGIVGRTDSELATNTRQAQCRHTQAVCAHQRVGFTLCADTRAPDRLTYYCGAYRLRLAIVQSAGVYRPWKIVHPCSLGNPPDGGRPSDRDPSVPGSALGCRRGVIWVWGHLRQEALLQGQPPGEDRLRAWRWSAGAKLLGCCASTSVPRSKATAYRCR